MESTSPECFGQDWPTMMTYSIMEETIVFRYLAERRASMTSPADHTPPPESRLIEQFAREQGPSGRSRRSTRSSATLCLRMSSTHSSRPPQAVPWRPPGQQPHSPTTRLKLTMPAGDGWHVQGNPGTGLGRALVGVPKIKLTDAYSRSVSPLLQLAAPFERWAGFPPLSPPLLQVVALDAGPRTALRDSPASV